MSEGHQICAICERLAPAIHYCPDLGGWVCDECMPHAMVAHRMCRWMEYIDCEPSRRPPAARRNISPPTTTETPSPNSLL